MPDSDPKPYGQEAHRMNEKERRFYRRHSCFVRSCTAPVEVLTSHLIVERPGDRPTRKHRPMCAQHGQAYAAELGILVEEEPVASSACVDPVRVSAVRMSGGSTGVSLRVPLPSVAALAVAVADGGYSLTPATARTVPNVEVPLTLDQAQRLRRDLDAKIGEIEAGEGGGAC